MIPVRLDRLTVKVNAWDESRVEEMVRGCGGRITVCIPQIRWVEVEIDHAVASDVFLVYERHPDVEYVAFATQCETHSVESYHAATNDDMLDGQFALKRMNVFHAWKHTRGAASVKIGVVDTGLPVDYVTWPEFSNAEREVTAICAHPEATPYTTNRHGTGTCATAAGAAGKGTGPVGVAPGCSLLSVRVVEDGTSTFLSEAWIAAADAGAAVVNSSWGASMPIGTAPETWVATPSPDRDAYIYLRDHDVLLCNSAGNSGQGDADGYTYPGAGAHLLGHLCVGGTIYEGPDKPVRYSTHGSPPDLVTPGNRNWVPEQQARTVPVTVPAGWVAAYNDGARTGASSVQFTRTAFNGTSCAAPLASGVAGLVRSANPTLTAQQARDVILSTVDRAQHPMFYEWFTRAGIGIANAARAVLKAKSLGAPGAVFPYLNFFGLGADVVVEPGVATTHLRGNVGVEIDAFSTDPLTRLALYVVTPGVGEELVWEGASPRTTWTGLIPFAAARLDGGKRLKIVASTAATTVEEEYTDVLGYATSTVPPRTTASPAGGTTNEPITLTADGANPPFLVEYRWNGGAWTPYTGPLQPQSGTLEYRATDVLGNREGG